MPEIEWERSYCLCGQMDDEILFERRDLMFDGDTLFHMVRCNACGIERLDPRPSEASILSFYPSETESYDPYRRQSTDGVSFKEQVRQADQRYGLVKRLRAIERYYPHGGRLLDVGAASGAFLGEVARSSRWQGVGVEPNAAVARGALERDLIIHPTTLAAASFPDGFFDVVTLWDVIEHVHDPARTIAEIARILKPKGLLVMSTPNLDSWDRSLFGKAWLGYELPRHLYLFRPKLLAGLVQAHGFEEPRFRSFFGSHSYFMSSVDFALTEHQVSPPRRRLVRRLTFSLPVRAIMMPYFMVSDALLRTTTMTLFARRCSS